MIIPFLFSHDAGVAPGRHYFAMLIPERQLSGDEDHLAGTSCALGDIAVLGGDGDGVPGIDGLAIFVFVPTVQPYASILDLQIGERLRAKGAEERRWGWDSLETGRLRGFLVVIDGVFIADRLDELANGAFFHIVGDRG